MSTTFGFLINFFLNIYNSLFDLSNEVFEFLSYTFTLDGQSYTIGTVIFGVGFGVLILVIFTKWLLS